MKKALFYGLWLLVVVLGARNVLGTDGLMAYRALREQHRVLEEEMAVLEKEKRDLARRIWRLQEDWDYIAAVAREQLNMVPPEALIYRFGEAGVQP